MKIHNKLYSTALVSTALVLFLIIVSPTVSAADAQNASSIITETNITTSDSAQILPAGTEEMSDNTEVTIYNENLAFVKEERVFDLKSGNTIVKYTDVPSQIDPTSVLVEDLTDNNTTVLEQQYEYDLASSSNLLDKYLGKEITVTDREGKTYTGKLLSHDEKGVVLEMNDGSVVALDTSKVEFSNTSGLLTKPTLVWLINSPTRGERNLLISYLTGGLSWSANYILNTSDDSTKADIRSWVSIDNEAGKTFENAKLKLVAGDIHRVSEVVSMRAKKDSGGVNTARAFSETLLSEYHLYTLNTPITLTNNQAKQISLLSADSVPVQKELVFDSWKGDKVQLVFSIVNSEAQGLGIPLPKGIVRVYQPDSEGQLQFLGEDQIDHTPRDQMIKVTVGSAFDIIGKRIQTNYEQVSNNVERTSYRIELNNTRSKAQDVKVVEHLSGDWNIIQSSDEYEKIDASTIEFKVSVPANGTKAIFYTVESKFGAFVGSTENTAPETATVENSTIKNITNENITADSATKQWNN